MFLRAGVGEWFRLTRRGLRWGGRIGRAQLT